MKKNNLFGLGHAYIRLPRLVVKKMFSEDPSERNLYQLYGLLLTGCNYCESTLKRDRYLYECMQGEIITYYRELSQKTGMSKNTLVRLLKRLEKEKRIAVKNIPGGKRIIVFNYVEITQKFISTESSPQYNTRAVKPVPQVEVAEMTQEEVQDQQKRREATRQMMQREKIKEEFNITLEEENLWKE